MRASESGCDGLSPLGDGFRVKTGYFSMNLSRRKNMEISVTSVTASHERESVTGEPPCDTSPVTNPPIRHKSTLMRRRDGWDGTAQTTPAAVCISCRQPLSYDDGTHTHPNLQHTVKEFQR